MNTFQPMTLSVPIVRFQNAIGLDFPQYATPMSAGMDLLAAISAKMKISPNSRETVRTGIGIALPPGFEAQIRPRSGLAEREGLTVLNSPGTIDADYRGEIMVILYNTSKDNVVISRGMKIAQLVIAPVARVVWNEITVSAMPQTQRGAGGFGSTGV